MNGISAALFLSAFVLSQALSYAQSRGAPSSSLKFTDVTTAAGLAKESSGWSAAFVDFDNDGWLDLHLINRRFEPSVLYKNQGDGTFTDVTEKSGLHFKTSMGHAIWVDLDNDGDLDCLVAGQNQDALFLNNGDGTFSSAGSLIGRAGTGREGRPAVGDFDRDGLVDIFACQTDGSPQRHPKDRGLLFKNLGDGKFRETGESVGLSTIYDAYAAIWLDLDQDGWLDLIVTSRAAPFVKTFLNAPNNQFKEATQETGPQNLKFGMRSFPVLSPLDLDNDGSLDLMIAGDSLQTLINLNGRLVPDTLPLPGQATAIAQGDINNDGWFDLFYCKYEAIEAWLGRGDGEFERAVDVRFATAEHAEKGLCLGDYDNDGDLDLFVVRDGISSLYRNDSPVGHWLKVTVEGASGEPVGPNTRLHLFSAGKQRTFFPAAPTNTGSHTLTDLHVGLGNTPRVDSIRVHWPRGQVQTLTRISGNQSLIIREPASVVFDDISDSAGIAGERETWGGAFADYDNDGDLDLAVTGRPGRLFRNQGHGQFEDVAEKTGIFSLGRTDNGVAWGDFNNDGRLDLFVTHSSSMTHRLLLGAEEGNFTDVSSEAGIARPGNGGPVLLADFDRNGFLDVLIPGAEPVQLFLNHGNMLFEEAGQRAGFDNITFGKGLAGCTGDYDNDGDIDVYLVGTNWSFKKRDAPNYLFRNRGNGTFEDVTQLAGVSDFSNSKAALFADYNNDGLLDLYVVNDGADNRLFRNNGDGTFTDVAQAAGVVAPFAAHSASFGDFDNDGDLDLYVSGASFLPEDSLRLAFGPLPDVLYRNDGFDVARGWTFTDITREAGIENPAHCVAPLWGDFDNDGDLDLFLGNNHDVRGRPHSTGAFNSPPFPADKLYSNRGNRNHYLHLNLIGHRSNRAAIGARIEAYSGDSMQMRDVEGGGMFASQNSLRVAFGFGHREAMDQLVIRWPTGIRQVFDSPPMDRILTIQEPFRLAFLQVERETLTDLRRGLVWVGGSAGVLLGVLLVIVGAKRAYPVVRERVWQLKTWRAARQRSRAQKPERALHDPGAPPAVAIKVRISLMEYKSDYLLTYRLDRIQAASKFSPAVFSTHASIHPYTVRAEKLRHLQSDLLDVYRSYQAFIVHGTECDPPPAQELRDLGYRIYRFFGLGGFFANLFEFTMEEPMHLDFALDSLLVPWHLAYDENTESFLCERFAHGISSSEEQPEALFRGVGGTAVVDGKPDHAILFSGDWYGSDKELKEVTAETRQVAKLLRASGVTVHSIYETIDDLVEKIVALQRQKGNLRIIHYAGHIEQGLLAAGEKDYLAPGFLRESYGLTLPSRPIVFLNGCGSANALELWPTYKNLAAEFIACGAVACIVADYPIFETSARHFARSFYSHLINKHTTVGEALRHARLDLSRRHRTTDPDPQYDITRYFYNLHGDPTAKF